jgi:hypothetical protein
MKWMCVIAEDGCHSMSGDVSQLLHLQSGWRCTRVSVKVAGPPIE